MQTNTVAAWHGLNGADVIAHDTKSGAIYVRLPTQLQRPIDGGCSCAYCKENLTLIPAWDTWAIPPKGTAWCVHMPDAAAFRAYLAKKR